MTDFYNDFIIDNKPLGVGGDSSSENFNYSIFGNGNSNYSETYQKVSRDLKQVMEKLYGKAFVECREGDQAENADESFEEWQQDIIKVLRQ